MIGIHVAWGSHFVYRERAMISSPHLELIYFKVGMRSGQPYAVNASRSFPSAPTFSRKSS